ncbi:MAG: hypothetical protein ACRCV9_18520 [Burkholderiaceae bacterium]
MAINPFSSSTMSSGFAAGARFGIDTGGTQFMPYRAGDALSGHGFSGFDPTNGGVDLPAGQFSGATFGTAALPKFNASGALANLPDAASLFRATGGGGLSGAVSPQLNASEISTRVAGPGADQWAPVPISAFSQVYVYYNPASNITYVRGGEFDGPARTFKGRLDDRQITGVALNYGMLGDTRGDIASTSSEVPAVGYNDTTTRPNDWRPDLDTSVYQPQTLWVDPTALDMFSTGKLPALNVITTPSDAGVQQPLPGAFGRTPSLTVLSAGEAVPAMPTWMPLPPGPLDQLAHGWQHSGNYLLGVVGEGLQTVLGIGQGVSNALTLTATALDPQSVPLEADEFNDATRNGRAVNAYFTNDASLTLERGLNLLAGGIAGLGEAGADSLGGLGQLLAGVFSPGNDKLDRQLQFGVIQPARESLQRGYRTVVNALGGDSQSQDFNIGDIFGNAVGNLGIDLDLASRGLRNTSKLFDGGNARNQTPPFAAQVSVDQQRVVQNIAEPIEATDLQSAGLGPRADDQQMSTEGRVGSSDAVSAVQQQIEVLKFDGRWSGLTQPWNDQRLMNARKNVLQENPEALLLTQSNAEQPNIVVGYLSKRDRETRAALVLLKNQPTVATTSALSPRLNLRDKTFVLLGHSSGSDQSMAIILSDYAVNYHALGQNQARFPYGSTRSDGRSLPYGIGHDVDNPAGYGQPELIKQKLADVLGQNFEITGSPDYILGCSCFSGLPPFNSTDNVFSHLSKETNLPVVGFKDLVRFRSDGRLQGFPSSNKAISNSRILTIYRPDASWSDTSFSLSKNGWPLWKIDAGIRENLRLNPPRYP